MMVNSIDPLAPYKASDDVVLELVSVTAIVKIDPVTKRIGRIPMGMFSPT
jgi:hypothetical protein